jgi:hypothetical protein
MPDHAQLTERQAQVLGFIVDFTAAHRYPPTLRDIRRRFGGGQDGTVLGLRRKGMAEPAGLSRGGFAATPIGQAVVRQQRSSEAVDPALEADDA